MKKVGEDEEEEEEEEEEKKEKEMDMDIPHKTHEQKVRGARLRKRSRAVWASVTPSHCDNNVVAAAAI